MLFQKLGFELSSVYFSLMLVSCFSAVGAYYANSFLILLTWSFWQLLSSCRSFVGLDILWGFRHIKRAFRVL